MFSVSMNPKVIKRLYQLRVSLSPIHEQKFPKVNFYVLLVDVFDL